MKTIYSLAFAFLFSFLIFSTRVQAQENVLYPRDLKDKEVKNFQVKPIKPTEVRERIKEKIATQVAKLSQKRQENIKKFWERLRRRLVAAIQRLEKLASRIERRLALIEQENPQIDTKSIRKDLADAEDMIIKAKERLGNADKFFEELINSDNPKASFEKVRNEVKEIRNILIDIHLKLVHIIGKIKGLRVGVGGKVSPSPKITVTVIPTPTPVPTNVEGQ